MERGSPTLNLNEVEAQEVKEHMYAAGSKVAGGPAAFGLCLLQHRLWRGGASAPMRWNVEGPAEQR